MIEYSQTQPNILFNIHKINYMTQLNCWNSNFLEFYLFIVLTTNTKNTRIRLTRLTLIQIFRTWVGLSRLLLELGSRLLLGLGSRLLLGLGSRGFFSSWALGFFSSRVGECTCKALRCQSQI